MDDTVVDTVVDIDQFQLLEEKVDSLIRMIVDLREEKELLSEKTQAQEREIADLRAQSEDLKTNRDRAKQRISSLLEKIGQIDI